MTQHVLIGVGGSGQHVVHAYLRLLTLTSPQTKSVPHVFILDADARVGTGADKRSTLIDDIVDLHHFLVSGDATPACCQILRPFRKASSGDPGSQVLGELIGVTENPALAALASGFLTDDDHEWGNDWTIELSKGMMANPKVGSIALAHKVEGAGAEAGGSMAADPEPPQFGRLFSVLKEGTRVAITGSNFGGTGSGVIPALVRQLDTRPGIDAVRAFMCLPWFSIEPGDSGDRTSAARDRNGVDPRARNSSLGLHTYYDELSGSGRQGKPRLKKSTYVLSQSMPQWPQEKRLDDGNFDQRENRHVLNLVQANAIQAFLGLGNVKAGAAHGSLYSIKTTAPAELRGQFDAARSPHLRFWAGANDSRQLVDLVADAEATAFALEKGGRVLATADDGSLQLKGVVEKLRDQPGLDRFAIAVSESLGKGSVKRGWFPRRDTAPDEVFKQLGAAMIDLANQIRSSLVWIDGHSVARAGADAGSVSGITGASSSHLFGVPEFGNAKQRLTDIDSNARLLDAWKALRLEVTNLSGQNMADAPPVSQGFALFNALFAPASAKVGGLDPVDGLIAEFSEERKVAKTDAGPTVAARVIAGALHGLVFAARNEARKKDSTGDDRQRSRDVEAGAGQLMLSLGGLTATPIDDCRLAGVELAAESVGGPEPFSKDHPMSLAYLDPYGGLTQNNAGQVNFAGSSFLEHGLRGIPNIAAPYLLQKWRIEKCRPRTDEEREERLYTEHDGRLRATKSGIYLHARRINEAALWLIVSADSRVDFVPDLFSDSNRVSAFARLLRKELTLSDNETLPALVFGKASREAGKPVFMWSGEHWYLAANSAARKFFGSLIAELPSVRHHYRSDNPLIRLDTPNASAIKSLDRFFAQQIQGAFERMEPAAALRDVLSKIFDDLPKPDAVETDQGEPPKSEAVESYQGESKGLWLRSTNNAHAELSVAPHKMVSQLQSFYCEPPVVFVDGKGNPNGLLPLRAKAWQMIEGGKEDNKLVLGPGKARIDAQSLAVRKVQKIQLKVTGLGRLEKESPFLDLPLKEVQQELAWSLGVWPNFRAENWNYYIISGMTRLGDPDIPEFDRKQKLKRVNVDWLHEGLEVALVVWGRSAGSKHGDEMKKLGEVIHGLPQRINGIPEVLEVVVGGRVLGSRRIELETVGGKNSVEMIGVDFGTSNTCVAVRQKEEEPDSSRSVPLLPGGSFDEEPVKNMLYYVDSGEELWRETFISKAAAFFHVKNANVKGDAGDTIPSELLVSLDDRPVPAQLQKARLNQAYDKDDKPYVNIGGGERPLALGDYPLASPLFTPLPPQPHGLDTDADFFNWLRPLVRMGDERLLGDLKWPRGSDDFSIQKSSALRALYLEHSIVVALAVLRRRGYCAFGKFVATKPEALSQAKDNFANTFGPDLVNIVSALSDCTGMIWSEKASKKNPKAKSDVFLVSETVAALYMTGFSEKKSLASVLTIDVGGGTTDVGVCLRYGRSGKLQQRHTASARFAGNKLLEALAQSKGIGDFFSRGGEQYSPDALKSLLKSELRRKSGPGIRTEQTGRLAEMFFDAVYEYAFKVLHLFMQVNPDWAEQFIADSGQVLNVVLLGNGFRLYEAFQAAGSGETIGRYNKEMLKRLVAAELLPEEVVAKQDKVRFVRPATPKSGLISVGGLNAAYEDDLFEEEEEEKERKVLLPKGLASSKDREGNTKLLDAPELIGIREFRKQWLGLEQSGKPRELSLELSNEAMKSQFPLTYSYWTSGREDRRDDLQNVFRSSSVHAPLYMDAAALYLTGTPTGSSFAGLLAQYAKDGS